MPLKAKNTEIKFGIILIVCHFLMWFIPAYYFGTGSAKNYYFISIFPLWFVLSVFGTFFVVLSMIGMYIYIYKKDIN